MATADKHSKTEPPTAKRKREAREKGQVARSPDVASWSALLVGSFLVPAIVSNGRAAVLSTLAQSANVMRAPSVPGAVSVLTQGLHAAFETVLPIAASFMVLGVATNLFQVGRSFSLKAARPKFERISPKGGLKRLFSPSTSVNLAKQTLKLIVLGGFAYTTIHGLLSAVPSTIPIGIAPAIGIGSQHLLGFIRVIALLGLVIGVGDFSYQRHRLLTSLKMTKQEVKDEQRQQEGDPTVKNELRKRQYAIARTKVIAAVRTADVIVSNPTHFAVALQYVAERNGAPRVVAKGSDELARRIREEAATCRIPVVEDPPLARYLFATCDTGAMIPAEIYVAVARLLAFVYSLPTYLRAAGPLHPVPSVVPHDPGEQTMQRSRTTGRRRTLLLQHA